MHKNAHGYIVITALVALALAAGAIIFTPNNADDETSAAPIIIGVPNGDIAVADALHDEIRKAFRKNHPIIHPQNPLRDGATIDFVGVAAHTIIDNVHYILLDFKSDLTGMGNVAIMAYVELVETPDNTYTVRQIFHKIGALRDADDMHHYNTTRDFIINYVADPQKPW